MPQADKRFIQLGTYILNLDQIIYVRSVENGLRIVTTAKHKDGNQYGILVPKAHAERVLQALRPFMAVTLDITAEE